MSTYDLQRPQAPGEIDMIEFVTTEDDLMLALTQAGESTHALALARKPRTALTVAHLIRAVEMGHVDFVRYALHERHIYPSREKLREWVELGDMGCISILLHGGLPPEEFSFLTTSGQDGRAAIRALAGGHYPETIAILDGGGLPAPRNRTAEFV